MDTIIKVSNLKKHFQEVNAVDDISFQVQRGQLYGLLGVNGAGKTTTINILCTLLSKSSGEVNICGYRLGKDNREIRKKIGIVFQENSLDDRLTVKENLIIRASLYNKSTKIILENLNRVSEVLGLEDFLNRRFSKLSGGQKRRCEIARALMNTPELLFLDEPTTGLDPHTRQNVWKSIESLRNELGMTVFLTTHYMEEVAKAQEIAIMDAGKIIAVGSPHQLKQQYASDILNLVPNNRDKIISYLSENNYPFEQRSNHLRVYIPDSLHGLKILDVVRDYLSSFEVIQETMDDVFR
ncbi:MAG: ABC transporter ATP-binding protein [Clostridiales bacterium]|nr:ABC transporter ATP-binding protein [Clostridiales bacterium]